MTKLEDYVAAGLRILPVDAKSKAPTMRGFGADNPEFCADPSEFESGETPAILCGPCPAGGDNWLICLDLDGGLELRDVEQILGPLPPTLASHGGAHVFYWVPPSEARDQIMQWTDVFNARRPDDKAEGRKAAALDLKWSGGYAIERDDWDGEFDVDRIAVLPESATAGLVIHGRKSNVRAKVEVPLAADGSFDDDGLENNGTWQGGIERIARFLETRPTDTAGDGGAGLFSVCCQLRAQFRLDSQTMFDALREFYAPRIPDEWSDSDLWHKIEDSKAGSLRGGFVQGEMVPQPARDQILKEKARTDPVFAAKLEAKVRAEQGESPFIDVATRILDLKPVDWLCERLRLAPGRPNMLYAHAHGGKSLATTELAVAAATGTKAFGDIEIRKSRVCYIENEDEYDLLMNASRICRGKGVILEPGSFVILPRKIYLGENEDRFNASVEALRVIFADFKFVIVNSLRALTPGTEENSSSFARPLEILGGLSEEFQTTVLVNHHVNKSTGGPRGTTAIEASEGNAWTLTNEEGVHIWKHTGVRMGSQQGAFELKMQRNASPPLPEHNGETDGITFRRCPIERDGDQNKASLEKAMQLIVARLRAKGRWLKRSEVLSDLGVKAQYGSDALAALVNDGKIGKKLEGQSQMYHHNPRMEPLS